LRQGIQSEFDVMVSFTSTDPKKLAMAVMNNHEHSDQTSWEDIMQKDLIKRIQPMQNV
jgi:hypothetical protein